MPSSVAVHDIPEAVVEEWGQQVSQPCRVSCWVQRTLRPPVLRTGACTLEAGWLLRNAISTKHLVGSRIMGQNTTPVCTQQDPSSPRQPITGMLGHQGKDQ